MYLSEKYFLLLKGQWNFNRLISDHGHMKGVASFSHFSMDPLTLFYREDGDHILKNGTSFSFFREYIYSLNQNYINVYFSHNKKISGFFYRLFFKKGPKNDLITGKHVCGEDIYLATYHFFGLNTFTLQYDIHGPAKNLQIKTLFQRQNMLLAF